MLTFLVVLFVLISGVLAYRHWQRDPNSRSRHQVRAWAWSFWGAIVGSFFGVAGFGSAIVGSPMGALIGFLLARASAPQNGFVVVSDVATPAGVQASITVDADTLVDPRVAEAYALCLLPCPEPDEALNAFLFAREAAEEGIIEAQFLYGFVFETGTYGSADPQSAADSYRHAAQQGHLESRYGLARIYLQDGDRDADPVQLLQWLDDASTSLKSFEANRLTKAIRDKLACL